MSTSCTLFPFSPDKVGLLHRVTPSMAEASAFKTSFRGGGFVFFLPLWLGWGMVSFVVVGENRNLYLICLHGLIPCLALKFLVYLGQVQVEAGPGTR